jgi:hypothetical protein
MDVAFILQDPELAFPDRHPCRLCRLPPDFAQGSHCISEFHSRTEPVPSGIVSMGRVPPGHRRICQSAQTRGSDQVSGSRPLHVFRHGHHFILQGPAPVGCRDRFHHFGTKCVVRSFCHHRVFDVWTSSSGIHFADRRGVVYGRLTADGARNSGRIPGGGLRRG